MSESHVGKKRSSRRAFFAILGLLSLPAVFLVFRRRSLPQSTVEVFGPLPFHKLVNIPDAPSTTHSRGGADSQRSPEVAEGVKVIRSGDTGLVDVRRVSLEVSRGTAEVKVLFQFIGDESPERQILVNARISDQDGHEFVLGQQVQKDARLRKPSQMGSTTGRPMLVNLAMFEAPFSGTQESVSRVLIDFREV